MVARNDSDRVPVAGVRLFASSGQSVGGYAPVLGVYGVSLAVAVSAGLFTLLWLARWGRQGKIAWAIVAVLWILGVTLREFEWTQPQGEPLKVSLAQGNIPQDMKFREETLVGTLETYRKLMQQSDARLIVLPETAVPLLRNEIPENYSAILRDHVRQSGGDIIVGAFEREQGEILQQRFYAGYGGKPKLP